MLSQMPTRQPKVTLESATTAAVHLSIPAKMLELADLLSSLQFSQLSSNLEFDQSSAVSLHQKTT